MWSWSPDETMHSLMVHWCPLPSYKDTKINLLYCGITQSPTPLNMSLLRSSNTSLLFPIHHLIYISITTFLFSWLSSPNSTYLCSHTHPGFISSLPCLHIYLYSNFSFIFSVDIQIHVKVFLAVLYMLSTSSFILLQISSKNDKSNSQSSAYHSWQRAKGRVNQVACPSQGQHIEMDANLESPINPTPQMYEEAAVPG